MIIVMKPGIPAEEELRVKSLMEGKGFQIHLSPLDTMATV